MSDVLILGSVVFGFVAVFTIFGLMIENYGWVDEEKDQFDKEF